MMNNSFFLLVFAFVFLSGQNQRFTYEYSSIYDSTKKAEVYKELLVLDANRTGSLFYSLENFKSDSTQTAEVKKQVNSQSDIINVKQTYKGKIFYTISKNYPDFKTFLHTSIGNDRYKVIEDRKPKWKILPDKQKIGELETQKAETDLFGRKWTAWFAANIPIQDGPYKFHGLPGLIVKIEDETKSYSFELKGISKYFENNKLEIGEETNAEKEISISQNTYKKLFLEQRNDPGKSLREMLSQSPANVKMFGPDGNEVKPAEILRQRELKGKENRKKNNNPLELDLLK